jgi:hypothetical protein
MERLQASVLGTNPYTIDCGLRIHGAWLGQAGKGTRSSIRSSASRCLKCPNVSRRTQEPLVLSSGTIEARIARLEGI